MARNRHPEEDDSARGALDERRRLVAATALFAAVAVILVLGAVLRTSGEDPGPAPAPPGTSSSTAVLGASTPTGEPSAVSAARLAPAPEETEAALEEFRPAAGQPVERRADDDRERLVRSGGSYTVQLMVACDPLNASRVVDAAGDAARLYVLPFVHDGRECYRVCWGSYATRQSAETAADLPEGLAAMFPNTRVRPVQDVTS